VWSTIKWRFRIQYWSAPMYSLNKQAISNRQQYDILSIRLYFEKEIFIDLCVNKSREYLEDMSLVLKWMKMSRVTTRDWGDVLEMFHECFRYIAIKHSKDWVTYSGTLDDIITFTESFAYSGRSITNADIMTRSSLLPVVRYARKQTRVEWKFDNNYCSRYQWDCYSHPRRPSKAVGVKAAPVASINFVIRRCAVLRLAKVQPTSQTNAHIYQPVPSLCGR